MNIVEQMKGVCLSCAAGEHPGGQHQGITGAPCQCIPCNDGHLSIDQAVELAAQMIVPTKVHLAGEEMGGVQRCARCGLILVNVRNMQEPEGAGHLPHFFTEGVAVAVPLTGPYSVRVHAHEGLVAGEAYCTAAERLTVKGAEVEQMVFGALQVGIPEIEANYGLTFSRSGRAKFGENVEGPVFHYLDQSGGEIAIAFVILMRTPPRKDTVQ